MSQGTAQKGVQPVSDNGGSLTVDATALPLPANAAQETGGALAAIIAELLTKARLTDTQPVSLASVPLPAGAATSANQATQITSLAAIAASLVLLTLAQNSDGATATGPLVQALVADAPPTRLDGMVNPLSMTADGRLRVSSAPSNASHDFYDGFRQDFGAGADYWGALPSLHAF
jgi:hypothetical protein